MSVINLCCVTFQIHFYFFEDRCKTIVGYGFIHLTKCQFIQNRMYQHEWFWQGSFSFPKIQNSVFNIILCVSNLCSMQCHDHVMFGVTCAVMMYVINTSAVKYIVANESLFLQTSL